MDISSADLRSATASDLMSRMPKIEHIGGNPLDFYMSPHVRARNSIYIPRQSQCLVQKPFASGKTAENHAVHVNPVGLKKGGYGGPG
nr:hypothetical protein HQ396_09755 [Aeromonas hydrophila]